MSESTQEMEQEVEESRAHLESTLEALRGKMSMGQVVDELGRQLRNSGGEEMARNFGRQLRNNPLPLALVGAGLAWLMLSDGRPPRHRVRSAYYGYDYDDEPVFYDEDDVYYPDDGGVGTVYEDGTMVADPYTDEPRRAYGAGETPFDEAGPARSGDAGGPGLGDRVYASAREGAEEVRAGARDAGHRAAGAMRGAAHRAGAAGRHAAEGAHGLGDRVSRGAHSAYAGARSAYEGTREGLHEAGSRVRRTGAKIGRRSAEMAEWSERETAEAYGREPLLFGALGIAVGAAIGLMLPSSRLEDRRVGPYRDHLRDDMREGFRHAVDEGIHRAEAAASAGYHAAKEEADAQGLTRKEGEPTLAERAEKVVEAGVEEAKKEAGG